MDVGSVQEVDVSRFRVGRTAAAAAGGRAAAVRRPCGGHAAAAACPTLVRRRTLVLIKGLWSTNTVLSLT